MQILKALQIVTLGASALFLCPAKADVITEFGFAYKLDSSAVLDPLCHTVLLVGDIVTNPSSPYYDRPDTSCGGDNPAFIGWPIAWESQWRKAFKYRLGWFHFSHWGDGGSDRETHMDLFAMSITYNWSRRK